MTRTRSSTRPSSARSTASAGVAQHRAVRRRWRSWSSWSRGRGGADLAAEAVPVPSLFALEEDQAVARVEAAGFEVGAAPGARLRAERAGPRRGPRARRRWPGEGATVTIRTAVALGRRPATRSTATAAMPGRSSRFALGGEPPPFAETVRVVVDRGDDVPVPAARPAPTTSGWTDPDPRLGRPGGPQHARAGRRPTAYRPRTPAVRRAPPRRVSARPCGCGSAARRPAAC